MDPSNQERVVDNWAALFITKALTHEFHANSFHSANINATAVKQSTDNRLFRCNFVMIVTDEICESGCRVGRVSIECR
jgi:hypothetical protein